MTARSPLLAIILAALAPSTFAQVADIAWNTDGSAQQRFEVAPARFVELCGALPAGVKVQWRFDAAAPLDFNVHYHVGKDVRFPARQDAVKQAEGTLDAPVAQEYCWMWTNKTAAGVPLSVTFQRVAAKP